jgi:hypothetical protein
MGAARRAPRARVILRGLALLALAALAVAVVVVRSLEVGAGRAHPVAGALLPIARGLVASIGAAEPAPEPEPHPEADGIRRDGHASIPGGVLFTPDSFVTEDGTYDLLLHLHGNTRVVRESVELARLNAVVAVVNLGVGSGPYEVAYAEPGTYERLLDSIDRALVRRGVEAPKRRRVALSSWSAGYGAVSTILQLRRGSDGLDAILLLDGLHCGWDVDGSLNRLQMAPFVQAARAAAAGQILFSITHSEIDPHTYASAASTASYLLDQVGARRVSSDEAVVHLGLVSAVGAVARDREQRMETLSDGRKGELHVRGYRGELPEHHMAHLFQMGATVLPELRERWMPHPSTQARVAQQRKGARDRPR